ARAAHVRIRHHLRAGQLLRHVPGRVHRRFCGIPGLLSRQLLLRHAAGVPGHHRLCHRGGHAALAAGGCVGAARGQRSVSTINLWPLIISFLVFYGIYFILSLSLNLEYGYAGLPNFGKVFFYSVGAYTAGSLTANVLRWASHGPMAAALGLQPVVDICTVPAAVPREPLA